MKFKCRCGHLVQLAGHPQTGPIECPYCGRAYSLSRGDDGKLVLHPPAEQAVAPSPPESPAEWPEGLELETPPPPTPPSVPTRPAPVAERPTRRAADRTEPVPRSWWYYLGTAWVYPFRGSAKWGLLLWLFFTVFVAPFLVVFLFFVPLIGFFIAPAVMIFIWGILLLYLFELIRQSSWDAEALPTLPSYEDAYESVVRPIGHLLATVIGSGIPLFVAGALVLVLRTPDWWRYALGAGLVLSLLMLPMNMLAVATADSAGAINPRFTFPAVARVIGPYLVYCIFYGLLIGVEILVARGVQQWLGEGFLSTFLGRAVWLYLLTVEARALGTLHYAYSDRMGWMKEAE